MFYEGGNLSQTLHCNKIIVNSSNINEFITLCMKYNSWNIMNENDTKHFILDRIIIAFPHLRDNVDKYRILV